MPALLNRLIGQISRALMIAFLVYGLAAPALIAPDHVAAFAIDAPAPQAPSVQPADTKPPGDHYGPLVIQASRYDASPTLRSIVPKGVQSFRKFGSPPEIPNQILPKTLNAKRGSSKTNHIRATRCRGSKPDHRSDARSAVELRWGLQPVWRLAPGYAGGYRSGPLCAVDQPAFCHLGDRQAQPHRHPGLWTCGGQHLVQRFWRGLRVQQRRRPDYTLRPLRRSLVYEPVCPAELPQRPIL